MTPTVNPSADQLNRKQIRAIFRRNYGSQAELARIAEVSPVSISQWLAGRFDSKKLEAAVRDYATEILRKEQSSSHVV